MAEGQGFEPWVGYKPTPVFKTGTLNHSVTPPQGVTLPEQSLFNNITKTFC